VPGAAADAMSPTVKMPALVWYPTATKATPQAMGPFRFAEALPRIVTFLKDALR
jgi:hypothetical protein